MPTLTVVDPEGILEAPLLDRVPDFSPPWLNIKNCYIGLTNCSPRLFSLHK
ncbi:hypothetical protein [Phormidium sp. CCY1219]|uniref:hypothetical protein n=1 Tax=Phormidium sp. CCY1219 TaxID=2886104 RepID=UPI002D789144|nr:hypothetical protein [Phormidium sp. CCY1219]